MPLRVLFTSYPGFGHLLPMLPLAQAVRRAGHDVVVATGPDLAPHAESHGLTAWSVGPTAAESFASVRAARPDLDSLPPGESIPLVARHLFAGATAAARARDLDGRVQSWLPDVVVHEPSELAAPVVATRVGSRRIVHGVGLPTVAEQFLPLLVDGIGGLAETFALPELAESFLATTYLDVCPRALDPGATTSWADVRPLRPASAAPAPGDRLPEALARLPYPETIHVTMGTVFAGEPGVFETVLAGLRSVRANVVVAAGPGADPARLGPQPPHVVIERFLPQSLLLPRCRLVVAHGGAGTMLASCAHGLPQLLLPHGADQFGNAQACVRAGAGLALEPDALTAEAVAAAVDRLLAETSFAAAAAGLRDEIAGMPSPDEVAAWLAETTPIH